MKQKAMYLPPQLTAVEFKAERGYAESSNLPLVDELNLLLYDEHNQPSSQSNVEIYDVHNDWGQGSGNHFWD